MSLYTSNMSRWPSGPSGCLVICVVFAAQVQAPLESLDHKARSIDIGLTRAFIPRSRVVHLGTRWAEHKGLPGAYTG